ncbi:hypothetical protein [Streptomyces silvensis]|uniref:hypothetical protein n=1 Tax=Streptomyces silvensis TaxID=1765722 RepID=UPI000A8ADD01|nr:hypothetical protein [Streptomyces silvensis]
MKTTKSRDNRPPSQPGLIKRLVPVWVNLLLGIPAMLPLHSAWLLLTKYRSCAWNTAGYASDCGDPSMVEGAGWHRMSVLVVGGLGLLLVLAVDVLFPASTGRRRRHWLTASLALPVPYVLAVIALAICN